MNSDKEATRQDAFGIFSHAEELSRAAFSMMRGTAYVPSERRKVRKLYRKIAIEPAIEVLDDLSFNTNDLEELGARASKLRHICRLYESRTPGNS